MVSATATLYKNLVQIAFGFSETYHLFLLYFCTAFRRQTIPPIGGVIMLPNQLRLTDGTIVRKDPVENIYSSENGDFYSPHNAILTDQGWIMRKLKAEISKRTAKSSHGGDYPKLRNYGNNLCHTLIARTWIGPRPYYQTTEGQTRPMEVDHLNGNILDWSASNLQYVTPAENRKRARLLRAMRACNNDPKQYTQARLKAIFASYDLDPGAPAPGILDARALTPGTLTPIDARMSRDMSRHAEL